MHTTVEHSNGTKSRILQHAIWICISDHGAYIAIRSARDRGTGAHARDYLSRHNATSSLPTDPPEVFLEGAHIDPRRHLARQRIVHERHRADGRPDLLDELGRIDLRLEQLGATQDPLNELLALCGQPA